MTVEFFTFPSEITQNSFNNFNCCSYRKKSNLPDEKCSFTSSKDRENSGQEKLLL